MKDHDKRMDVQKHNDALILVKDCEWQIFLKMPWEDEELRQEVASPDKEILCGQFYG